MPEQFIQPIKYCHLFPEADIYINLSPPDNEFLNKDIFHYIPLK